MKLNPDCIRDILFYVEEKTDLNHHIVFTNELVIQVFPKYTPNEVFYHLRQCEMSNFFQKSSRDLDGNHSVSYLSPIGHQFIANIRSDNIWNNVKSVSKKIGVNSLSALSQIATSVVTEIIKSQLGLI